MNLAIRGIDSSQVKWNNEGSFLNDAHKDVKADYIIANPPFNVSDWGGELLRNDGRWGYGAPPVGNANFGWMQHFIYHLSPTGQAGVVLSKGALTSKSSGEGDIRKALIEGGLIDCIVNLPAKLFLNTQIPAALWFMSRNRKGSSLSGGQGASATAVKKSSSLMPETWGILSIAEPANCRPKTLKKLPKPTIVGAISHLRGLGGWSMKTLQASVPPLPSKK
jgi:hypothetical protein